MKMKCAVICCLVAVCVMYCQTLVLNSNFRSVNRFAPPYQSSQRQHPRIRGKLFTLTRRFHRGRQSFGSRAGTRQGFKPFSQSSEEEFGETAELKAREGSIDFTNEHNAIVPNKAFVKPTKAPRPERNENKINIETRIDENAESIVKSERVVAGETAILHCTFDTTGQVGAYEQAQIWWTKLPKRSYDRPIILSAGNQIRIPDDRLKAITFPDNAFSILVIRDAIEEDAGDYKCSLPTITGTKTAFASLEIRESSRHKVSTSPKENTMQVGDTLSLFCNPSDSRLKVWWTAKDDLGNNIEVGDGFDRKAGAELLMYRLRREQAGIYTCHVENQLGSPIRRHFTVLVEEKPRPITGFRDGFNLDTYLSRYTRDPQYTSSVSLRCDSGGVPVPEIKWLRNGQLLTNNNKYLISSHEPSYKDNSIVGEMTITNLQPSDDGTYTCVAENSSGQQEKQFQIRGYYKRIVLSEEDDEDYIQPRERVQSRNRVWTEGEGSGGDY